MQHPTPIYPVLTNRPLPLTPILQDLGTQHYPQKIGRRMNPSGKAEGALMPVREDSSEYQHTGKISLNGLIKAPM